MIRRVVVTDAAKKQLRKAPQRIARKPRLWVDAVQNEGLLEVRKIPGFHDEPLHGKRRDQRSIRLSRQWRAIYVVKDDGGGRVCLGRGGYAP